MPAEIALSLHPSEADREAIRAPLLAYNEEKLGPHGYAPLALLLRDPKSGATVGGLWGDFFYDWLFVEIVFVPLELRGARLGSQLLSRAEEAARQRGCVGVWLDTFSVQAPDFYRKQGYDAFGTLEDYPRGKSRVFFRKIFAQGER